MGKDSGSFRKRYHDVAHPPTSFRKSVRKELALFLGLLFLGLVLLPVAIFFVGQQVFGDYGGAGFAGFFNTLGGNLRQGNWVAWFLVLAPYLAWQTVRLTRLLWRIAGHSPSHRTTAGNR